MHADWFKTQLAQSVEAMKAQIYIWMIKANKLIFLICVVVFPKRNRKHVLCVSIRL